MDENANIAGQGRVRKMIAAALILNGFAFVAVNYWIYTARWWFIDTQGHVYLDPPTISRAISPVYIGEPFALWITVSGLALVVGIALLLVHYIRILKDLPAPQLFLRMALFVTVPSILALQLLSALGMNWLSTYRFPDFHAEHMLGSYMFFGAQTGVILLYMLMNFAFLRDRESLDHLESRKLLDRRWVRYRLWGGTGSFALMIGYFALFTAKDHTDNATVYLAYVSLEPVVISSFLLVLMLSHFDKLLKF